MCFLVSMYKLMFPSLFKRKLIQFYRNAMGTVKLLCKFYAAAISPKLRSRAIMRSFAASADSSRLIILSSRSARLFTAIAATAGWSSGSGCSA